MSEAKEENYEKFPTFNDFFVRELKEDARPIDSSENSLACPADGAVSQIGKIEAGSIFQAKGHSFTAEELLGGDNALAEKFSNGNFTTIYLSPKDYHRLHMPLDGKLVSMTHVPGKLFSVNPATTAHVPRLFARNERVVCVFDTEIGEVALVLVGAMIVASIETTWAGLVAPAGKQVSTVNYENPDIRIAKGEEFARFKLGSTIIMLFPEGKTEWEKKLESNSAVRMGQAIATRC